MPVTHGLAPCHHTTAQPGGELQNKPKPLWSADLMDSRRPGKEEDEPPPSPGPPSPAETPLSPGVLKWDLNRNLVSSPPSHLDRGAQAYVCVCARCWCPRGQRLALPCRVPRDLSTPFPHCLFLITPTTRPGLWTGLFPEHWRTAAPQRPTELRGVQSPRAPHPPWLGGGAGPETREETRNPLPFQDSTAGPLHSQLHTYL